MHLEGICKGKLGVDKKTQCIVWDEVAWEKFPNLFHFFFWSYYFNKNGHIFDFLDFTPFKTYI